MTHEHVRERLSDLLADRDQPELLAHVAACHDCQQQLFRLYRVDRMLRTARPCGRRGQRLVSLLGITAAAAAAVAAVVLFGLVRSPTGQTTAFVLHTADGRALARAVIRRADDANDRIVFVARGMPVHAGDRYLLWTKTDKGRSRVPVGTFMVSRTGACRASFRLPASGHWAGFWVTPASDSSLVVAST